MLRPGAIVIGLLSPHERSNLDALAQRGVTGFALERLPRITRAQTMDVLSSQANIAGYKAVIIAADQYRRFMPMLMTAAGTVKAARVLVLGAGVAGLQAIATAKRLGAVIEAFDVRPATKEQVESLGAKFVEVPVSEEERQQAESAGGYARQMSDEYQRRQSALIDERARAADIIITTALVPGKPAPVLIREETIRAMKPGSVLVDLAVEQGGNCPLTEKDRVVVKHGVTLVGHSNLPAMLAADASALYARNVLTFVNLLVDPKSGAANINRSDEIIAGALVCVDGAVVTTNH
jgi:NAD(P) transhydrogenase subunit alpha